LAPCGGCGAAEASFSTTNCAEPVPGNGTAEKSGEDFPVTSWEYQ